MSKLFRSLVVLLALPFVLAGCKINSINYFPPKPAHIRVINVLGTTTPINVTANGVAAWSGLTFEAMTGYQDFNNATTEFVVSLAGSTTPLVSQSYNPAGEQSYTLVVYGPLNSPQIGVIADVLQPPPSNQILVTVFNAAPVGNGLVLGNSAIDVYLTPPGQPIDSISPNFFFITYGTGNVFGQFSSGQYELRLTITGTKTLIYDSGPLTFQSATATDVVIYSKGSAVLANVLLDDSDGAGQQVVANSLLARIKAVNGAFQTGPVNQLLNGVAITSNVALAAASTYNNVPSGAGTVTFEATSAPGAAIASISDTLGAATDQSIFVSGFAGATTAVALQDNNLPPPAGFAAVRFVNTSPNSNPLNVLANNVSQVSSLGTYAASGYMSLASGTVTFTFNDSTTGATVLTMPGITLNAQQTSSVYVVGPAGALAGFVTPDTP